MIDLKNISKSFNKKVVENISLKVNEGEIIGLLGPSGCGKTTLLRIISGLEKIDSGEVFIDEKKVDNTKVFIEPKDRNVGMIFQDFALFPHLTVKENIAMADNSADQKINVKKLIDEFGLEDIQDKYPAVCSGGQKQRTAIARSIAQNPKILLLDEPFGQIDEHLKFTMRTFLKQYLKKNKITAIFVTHDHQDAFELGDKVVLMNSGKIEQIDTPMNIAKKPANKWSALFLGHYNIIDIDKISNSKIIETQIGDFEYSEQHGNIELLKYVIIPSFSISISKENLENSIMGTINNIINHGFGKSILVEVNKKIIKLQTSNNIDFNKNEKVYLSFGHISYCND
jgi:iron(III) transport system ATP-binding protein